MFYRVKSIAMWKSPEMEGKKSSDWEAQNHQKEQRAAACQPFALFDE
jgi:ribosomal protein S10